MEGKVKLIDSPTGTGKTSWAINYINSLPKDVKVIYVTPFKTEYQRIMKACAKKKVTTPDVKQGRGSKATHFLNLINQGENIATTHSLLSNINRKLVEALKQSDYILILDETFNVVNKYDMWEDDPDHRYASQAQKDKDTRETIISLMNIGCIKKEDDYRIKWIDWENNPQPKYAALREMCDRDLIYWVDGNLLMWTFPHQVFEYFRETYILSYQFEYQMQSYYFKYFGIEFEKYHIDKIDGKYSLVKTENNEYEIEWIKSVKHLINIENSSINKKGIFLDHRNKVIETALSKTWYIKNYKPNPEKIEGLKNTVVTWFMNYTKSKGEERLWTCFKPFIHCFQCGNLSKKNWLAFNARAMNEYGNRTAVAYLVNRYPDPIYLKFFGKRNVMLDRDGYALSEMIQFIWRSAVRNWKPIQIFIPSERMRNILISFLNLENIEKIDAQIDFNELENEDDNFDEEN